jgi:DNA uptake protein ComE-like DNA-binding protein
MYKTKYLISLFLILFLVIPCIYKNYAFKTDDSYKLKKMPLNAEAKLAQGEKLNFTADITQTELELIPKIGAVLAESLITAKHKIIKHCTDFTLAKGIGVKRDRYLHEFLQLKCKVTKLR